MSTKAKLKVAGTWTGVLEVELASWSVSMLREEVARRSNVGPESINLISGGRILRDGDGTEKLTQLGIRNNGKILSTRISVADSKSLNDQLLADEERNRRLSRIKASVTALSNRHADGSLPLEDFNLELEDQHGRKLHFSESDRQAIMMGLMLHANGKQLIRKQLFNDALEVLMMGEEAFSLCNPIAIELVDNIPILQIDMVWCYLMLRDISWLAEAGVRIEKAREGLEHAHGKDSCRLRLLQAGRSSELALYLRLELLEGVVAYHSGQHDKSRRFLTSAQAKFNQLQVPDEALSMVMSMGFKENEAKRALRLSHQNVESAVDFLVEEKEKRAKKREDDIRRRDEIREQKKYGVTPSKKAVDLERLKQLVTIGYDTELAAEALRRNENDILKALDDLTNPDTNSTIQNYIETRKRKRQQATADSMLKTLESMGFERSRVLGAVEAGGSLAEVANRLLTQGSNSSVDANTAANAPPTDNILENLEQDYSLAFDGPSSSRAHEERDVEMEDGIAEEIARRDAWSDYDIEVAREGEAINEYLALLDSASNNENASSSM